MRLKVRLRSLWLPLALPALSVVACALPVSLPASTSLSTQAAQTAVAAFATRAPAMWTPTRPGPTLTPVPPPSDTPVPTLPPAATGDSDCTDDASFVADLTVPDDTNFPAGQAFTKSWRLKNTGTCTWTSGYTVVFIDGNSLGAPAAQPLPGPVAPNETVDISVELRAPVTTGIHRGNWKLRSEGGMVFGIGGGGPFYVQIVVGPTLTPGGSSRTVYDLTADYCAAEWRSGAGVLPCPGTEGDPNGYVLRLDEPHFENDVTEDEPTLLTRPQMATDGAISGRYPALQVQNGYHLRTHIGCRYGSTECDVIYQLNYRIDGGTLQNLRQWSQRYDGEWQKIDVDLSGLSGKSVEFVLAVAARGASSTDDALWLNPKIIQ